MFIAFASGAKILWMIHEAILPFNDLAINKSALDTNYTGVYNNSACQFKSAYIKTEIFVFDKIYV